MALDNGYIKPSRRIFDNAKVSDHFAIIPTLEAPKGLSEAEQKLYDLVARRFMSVFFPSAEYLVTTRISRAREHSFRTEGKVLVQPGWLAIYGKEAQDENTEGPQSLVPVTPGEIGWRRNRRRPRRSRPGRPRATRKPRCSARWKAPASWSKTTSCATRCRRRGSARPRRARRSSKACSTRST